MSNFIPALLLGWSALARSVFVAIPFFIFANAAAQDTPPPTESSSPIVEYPASFFELYKPNNALDMIRQVPGFQINNGEDNRGFAGSAGNILINGQRPSAKDDSSSSILSRIPASQVIRIRHIRGQVRGIDLRGQSSIVDVVLSDDSPAAISWEAYSLYGTASPLRAGA